MLGTAKWSALLHHVTIGMLLTRTMQLPKCLATITLAGVITVSNAQSLDELKKQKELADTEKQAIDAQTALIESKKKRDAALGQPSASEARQSAELASANAAKAVADAQKGKVDAELAVLKAKLAVPSSGISGTVETKTNAAALETNLLAARATTQAAQAMATLAASAVKGRNVYILSPGDLPDFQAALAYRFQFLAAQTALTDAMTISMPTPPAGGEQRERTSRESVAGVGLAVEAATKLLGFFKSDFTVAGDDTSVDNQMLQQAFAGELAAQTSGPAGVFMPALYAPLKAPVSALPPEFDKLTAPRADTKLVLAALEAHSARLTGRMQGFDAAAKAEKEKLDQELKENEAKVTQAKAALSTYDGLVARFQAPDGGGASIIRHGALLTALSDPDSVLVIVKLNKAGGSNYTEKNLWTILGAIPFKVAGGAIASFTAFEAHTGKVKAAGTIEIHGGFAKINKVSELFPLSRYKDK